MFWVVFLGFYLNNEERKKIREKKNKRKKGGGKLRERGNIP